MDKFIKKIKASEYFCELFAMKLAILLKYFLNIWLIRRGVINAINNNKIMLKMGITNLSLKKR